MTLTPDKIVPREQASQWSAQFAYRVRDSLERHGHAPAATVHRFAAGSPWFIIAIRNESGNTLGYYFDGVKK
jgi:hypothetical protein